VNKLKHLAVAALAAAAIGAGALVAPPTASATTVSCEQATAIAEFYTWLAQIEQAALHPAAAAAWLDRAFLLVLNSCAT
jgi:hypothetical protein